MNEYKELIDRCEHWIESAKSVGADDLAQHIETCKDAIEQLVNDRNASVDALKALVKNIE